MLLVIIGIGFILRVINLNYNSPFNDEAIYIVLGRLGLFQGDWWTYNAAAWMAGQPYIYPSLSAIAYITGGIIGSRFLNVIFGVLAIEAVFNFTRLISPSKDKDLAGLISALVLATAGVSLYISRLATFDLLSFYLFLLSLNFLLTAGKANQNYGKWYFLAFIFLILSFFTKIIIAAYIPFVVIFSYYYAQKLGIKSRSYWLKYFFFPLVAAIIWYLVFNYYNLLVYAASQVARDKNSSIDILAEFWSNTQYIWYLWAAGSIGLWLKKQWRLWLAFTLAALIIPVIHLASHRQPTLDKHTYLSVLFLIPLISIGLSNLITYLRYLPARIFTGISVLFLLIFFSIISYQKAQSYNKLWHNYDPLLAYLAAQVKPGERVLAEVGAAAILATYDHNYPTNTNTFDWFEYKHLQGKSAYLAAIKDGYFNYIELDGGDQTLGEIHSTMHNLILDNIATNYRPVYNQDEFIVYQRTF
jgi:4-amino-4-deoxy-L-arabinose transferase-like glycosyltransferase